MNDMPGSITISTVAMLTFPRSLDPSKGPRNKVFDINLNIPDGREKSTLGLLRYFVPENLMNNVENITEFSQAFIIATISVMPPNGPKDLSITTADIVSWSDYAFIGDILQLIFVDNIDNDYEPYINICGTVVDSDKNQSSFDLRPTQYVQLLRTNSDFPAHLTISDSKRWAKNKPIPSIGTSISIGGFLQRVKRTSTENSILFFHINVTNVAYITDRTHFRDAKNCNEHTNPSTTPSRTRFNYQAQKTFKAEKRKITEDSDDIAESSHSSKKQNTSDDPKKQTDDHETFEKKNPHQL